MPIEDRYIKRGDTIILAADFIDGNLTYKAGQIFTVIDDNRQGFTVQNQTGAYIRECLFIPILSNRLDNYYHGIISAVTFFKYNLN